MGKKFMMVGLLVLLSGYLIEQEVSAILTVDPVNGNDGNNCISAPCKTIKTAIAKANNNDWIFLEHGTYSVATNGETFPVTITKSLDIYGNDATKTILDASGTGQSVIYISGSEINAEVSNLTIKKGLNGIEIAGSDSNHKASSYIQYCIITENSDFGILALYAQTTILRNDITWNGKDDWSAGIKHINSGNTVVHNVIAATNGSAIWNENTSNPWIMNNTIAWNMGGCGITNFTNSSPKIINNIIAFNGAYGIHADATSFPDSHHNDVWWNGWGNYFNVIAGVGSLSADPRFVSLFDLHLACSSPAINAGDMDLIAPPYYRDKDNNPLVGTVDMGAYEKQDHLYCPTFLPLIIK